jgi:hypothetical protein
MDRCEPGPAGNGAGAVRPPRRGRPLLPVAAAVAIAVLVAGAVLLRPAHHRSPRSLAVPVAPPFYVTANGDGTVSVRSAATGAQTASLNHGAGWLWIDVSATANSRVFYLAADNASFSRLVLTGSGHLRSLTTVGTVAGEAAGEVAVPRDNGLTGVAVSPDGENIAFAVLTRQSKGGPIEPAQLEILSLSSRHYTIYRSRAYRTQTAGTLTALAWAGDGRHLGYVAEGSGNGTDGVWVLDTGAGNDLVAASHRVTRDLPANLNDGSSLTGGDGGMAVTADGRDVYTLGMKVAHGRGFLDVAEIAVTTGTAVRTVFLDPHGVISAVREADGVVRVTTSKLEPTAPLLASGGTGLLLIDGYGHTYRIDLATGRSVLLTTDTQAANVAW